MLLSRESRGGGVLVGPCWLVVRAARIGCVPLPPADAAAGIEAWLGRGSPAAGPGRGGAAVWRSAERVRACGCACAGEVLAPGVGRVGGLGNQPYES